MITSRIESKHPHLLVGVFFFDLAGCPLCHVFVYNII